MKLRVRFMVLICLLGSVALSGVGMALAQDTVVRAILFYSPSCPHCHKVMTEDLPPLRETYGEQLQIVEVDTSTTVGTRLSTAMLETYEPELVGVPTLVIGDRILVGSLEIPQELPGLIEEYLAAGGIDWPDLAGIEDVVPAEEPAPPPTDSPTDDPSSPSNDPSTEDPTRLTWRERFAQDPLGNSISVAVLVALIVSVGAVISPQPWQKQIAERFLPWGLVVIGIIGLVAAVYLAYVETTASTAVCGPVGDCNAVQQSRFAKLFGVFPVAVFGVLGYVAILLTFAYGQLGEGKLADWAPAGVFLMALFGVFFSTYLTFLEPFVIGATCMWCLTSSVCMALILILSAGPGWAVLRPQHSKKRYRPKKKRPRSYKRKRRPY